VAVHICREVVGDVFVGVGVVRRVGCAEQELDDRVVTLSAIAGIVPAVAEEPARYDASNLCQNHV
jgi:hypothetical protein